MLKAAEVVRRCAKGAAACTWSDNAGELVAGARLQQTSPESLQIHFGCRSFEDAEEHFCQEVIQLATITGGMRARQVFDCPKCKRRTEQLILTASGLRCRICQGVRYISQRHKNHYKIIDKMEEVNNKANRGRIKGTLAKVSRKQLEWQSEFICLSQFNCVRSEYQISHP